jgi:activator of HSP90 ATPase
MATIIQKILFKNTTRESLYNLYMDAKLHSLITGSPAEVTEKVGSRFMAFDGYITGTLLQLVKNQLIVQSWHGSDWDDKDPDSVFILAIEQKGNDVLLHVAHANVPDRHEESLSKGWHDFYWRPWKKYLSASAKAAPGNNH